MADGKRRYGRSRRDLAEVAGYSPRTFFRQVAAKEDVVFFDLPDILSPLEDLLREPPASAWDAVVEILLANSATWEAAGRPLAQNRTRLIYTEPALHRRYLEISGEWETVIAGRVAMQRWVEQPETGLGAHLAAGLKVVEEGFRRRR